MNSDRCSATLPSFASAAAPNPIEENIPTAVLQALDDVTEISDLADPTFGRLGLGRRGGDTKVATAAEMRDNPVHAKHVNVASDAELTALMTPEAAARFTELLKDLRRLPQPADKPPTGRGLCMPSAHAETFIAAGQARRIPSNEAAAMWRLEYFGVLEHVGTPKQRIRGIMWPEGRAEQSTYSSDFSLRTHAASRAALRGANADDVVLTTDVACAYYHIGCTSTFFVELDDGGYVGFDRLPFGIDLGAEVMELATAALTGRRGVAAAPAQGTVVTHIDNAMYVGGGGAVWAAETKRRAARCGVTLSEMTPPARTADFCGMVLDFDNKTVALMDKTVSKLRKDHARMNDVSADTSAAEFVTAHARVTYAATALGHNIAADKAALFATKHARRLANGVNRGTLHRRTIVAIAPSVRAGMLSLLERGIANEPVSVTTTHPSWHGHDLVLATDATPQGWGAVIYMPGQVPRAIGSSWPKTLDINVAETAAIAAAAEIFHHDLISASSPLIVVDNTSAVAAASGRASSLELRRMAAEVTSRLPAVATIRWIATAENPADAPSRAFRHDAPGPNSRYPHTRAGVCGERRVPPA